MQSILRRGLLLAVYLAFVGASVEAETWGKECSSSSDCGDGATCVAGDSVDAVQRCVAGTPCGGKVLGACPGDDTSGQLACIWRPNDKVCYPGYSGCLEIDGKAGIYQCISLSRCDQYLSGSCSKGCNTSDKKQCNDRGTCTLAGYKDSTPTFKCECQSGWNGTLCDNVIDDSCIANVGQCGTHGTCKSNSCECTNGYTGDQCEIPPASLSSSGSGGVSPVSTPKSSTPTPSSTSASNNSASRANGGEAITKKDGGPSALVIIMAILVALIVVGAIIFVIFARRKRRQQEAADASGFNRSDSVIVAAEGARPPTPKGKIVIM